MNINGTELEFARITLDKQEEIQRIATKKVSSLFPRIQARLYWRRFCRLAFKMDFVWRYLHIPPKCLWYNEISLGLSGEIQASFFGLYKEELSGLNKHLETFLPSSQKTTG